MLIFIMHCPGTTDSMPTPSKEPPLQPLFVVYTTYRTDKLNPYLAWLLNESTPKPLTPSPGQRQQ